MNGLNWDMVRLFLAIAKSGSITDAAKDLHMSQPTLGRKLTDFEEALGVTLFLRGPAGMVLTSDGEALLAAAESMDQAASEFTRSLGKTVSEVAGSVRISASHVVSTCILPDILTQIRDLTPQISLELVATDELSNLLRRDADIAVRMIRPTQLDVVIKHMGSLTIGAYAAPGYIERFGLTNWTPESLQTQRLIGFDRSTDIIDGLNSAGLEISRDAFSLRCDNQVAYMNLVKAGGGVGFLANRLAANANLIQIPLPVSPPKLDVWLAIHKDLKQNPAASHCFDLLKNILPEHLDS